jgi:uncharacterized C2H2 Zn-finger protein
MLRFCTNRPIPQDVSEDTQNVIPVYPNVIPIYPNVIPSSPDVNPPSPNVNIVATPENIQFQCVKCLRDFSTKGNLKRHIDVCDGTLSAIECPKCNKVFASRQSKYKHMKACKGMKTQSIQAISPDRVQVTRVPYASSSSVNVNTASHSQIAQNIQNIYINNFGSENTSHITKDVLDKRLKEFNGIGLANLITDTHFNPDRPENHNIRADEDDKQLCRVKKDDGWTIESKMWMLDFLMSKYRRLLALRTTEKDFQTSLQNDSDYQQIQMDIMSMDKTKNSTKYYAAISRIIAAMKSLEEVYAT